MPESIGNYRTRWYFEFASERGTEYRIDIKQLGYPGTARKRSLGRTPVLRRERNGRICGSSLELYAECQVDGEFKDLYTTYATKFLVQVVEVRNGADIPVWEGFVSPEFYSEPDIAPPYDVQILATDNLGELKYVDWKAQGLVSLASHLSYIMGQVGYPEGSFHLPTITTTVESERYGTTTTTRPATVVERILTNNRIGHAESTAPRFFLDTFVDLDYFAEASQKRDANPDDATSCYDVLEKILTTLNAEVMDVTYGWVVLRETDLPFRYGVSGFQGFGLRPIDASALHKDISVPILGQYGVADWAPSGQLSSKREAAKKSVTINAPIHAKESLLRNPHMTEPAVWTMDNGAYFGREYKCVKIDGVVVNETYGELCYQLDQTNARISQVLERYNLDKPTTLKIDFRVTSLTYSSVGLSSFVNSVPFKIGFILKRTMSNGTIRYYKVSNDSWVESEYINQVGPDESAYDSRTEIEVAVPNIITANGVTSDMTFTLVKVVDNANTHVYGCSLALDEDDVPDDESLRVAINNNAREVGEDIELAFNQGAGVMAPSRAVTKTLNGIMYNDPTSEDLYFQNFTLAEMDSDQERIFEHFIELLGYDQGRQHAFPREVKSGRLIVDRLPSMEECLCLPVVLQTVQSGTRSFYTVQSCSFDLCEDEMDIEIKAISYVPPTAEIYGVRHHYNEASPTLTRIGDEELHRTLPVQRLMRRCVVDDSGAVLYYLQIDDSTKRADGSSANIDGSDGQVMVEVPAHYRRTTINAESGYIDTEIALLPFSGAVFVPKYYVSAYEATIDRLNNQLASVCSMNPRYRGGNNYSEWDGSYRTFLGRPADDKNRAEWKALATARGKGWGIYDYNIHVDLFWLFAIEYATLNSQAEYSRTLTPDAFHQGGLGAGVTTFSNWPNYNGEHAFVPCGHANSLGNGTGLKVYSLAGDTVFFGVPSYRGIENPFGHLSKIVDGARLKKVGDELKMLVCRHRSDYDDVAQYSDLGAVATASNYVRKLGIANPNTSQIIRRYGDILIGEVGGSSSTYFCDAFWLGGSDNLVPWVGGDAGLGDISGMAFSWNQPENTSYARTGTRLTFLDPSQSW